MLVAVKLSVREEVLFHAPLGLLSTVSIVSTGTVDLVLHY